MAFMECHGLFVNIFFHIKFMPYSRQLIGFTTNAEKDKSDPGRDAPGAGRCKAAGRQKSALIWNRIYAWKLLDIG
jgi:hypothetical protein